MDITEWYAISLGCLAVLPIIARLFLSIPIVHIYGSFYLRENVRYPCIYRYLRRSGQVIRVDLLILVAFLVGNALCLAINVKGIPEFAKRSGVVSIINLIPLSLGANMNFIASLGGISLPAYAKLHRWLGRVAIIEGLIHAVSYHKLNLRTMPDVAALTVSIAIQEDLQLTSAGRNCFPFNSLFQAPPLARVRSLFEPPFDICRCSHLGYIPPHSI